MRRAAAAVLCLALSACAGDLESGSLLDRPRVLGVRVDVEGAPGRAAPAPGETFSLSWLVASPDDVSWTGAMRVCLAAPNQIGFAGCAGEPFFMGATGLPSLEPSITVTSPGPEAFSGLPGDLLVLGIFCAGGLPTADGCSEDSAEAEIVTFRFPADLGLQPANQHPSIVDETFTYDEAPWDAPPAALPATGCASTPDSPSFPHVAWASEDDAPQIGLTTQTDDREPYLEFVFGETLMRVESREELSVAHLATAGWIARPETIVFADETPNVDVPWRHPDRAEVPGDGLTVEFIFVMRDGRGGMDWTRRALCLLP